ncbi:hypothetical protein LRAMOSA11418 [Lichtheimia ramosa]|uniref:Uncharacterized protein n=1 Tax=Lichtheimia ramosa TaxID=688394 RepID=A0A077WW06_9FUNG|nr:hypothetical protein LRAMOSA11418 [Lichtheimia ramosa]
MQSADIWYLATSVGWVYGWIRLYTTSTSSFAGSSSSSTAVPVSSSPHVSSCQQVHDSLHALRRALGNEIARRVAAVTGGNRDVISKTGARIEFLRQEIESMQELAVLVAPPHPSAQVSSSSVGSRIPPGLPYMQWTGYVWCNEYHTYPTVQKCLLAFEHIIRAASCDINQVWHKYLPIRLSPKHRSWSGVVLLIRSGIRLSDLNPIQDFRSGYHFLIYGRILG